jgi:hypothetical protein
MAGKPETTFYTNVHRHLPPLSELHREKMANPYRGGTFDHWYSGVRDLWVEWKFIVLPKRGTTLIDICGGKNPSMSALQQNWGERRFDEGRNVWVIIGCAEGGVILRTPLEWSTPFTAHVFRASLQDRKTLAREITNFTQGLA